MIEYVDKHIIEFVDEWSTILLPQLNKVQVKDLTTIFSNIRKNKMILSSIKEGKKVYVIGFKHCRGMIKKWLYDDRGRMIRENGRCVIQISPSVVTMAAIDIVVPFISSDEVLLTKYARDRPYNLEKEIVMETMSKSGFNPKKDIIFMFFEFPEKIESVINRFIDELRHLITFEYCRTKGVLAIKDPKWMKYHTSDQVTKYTNAYFFGGVRLTYSRREGIKEGIA